MFYNGDLVNLFQKSMSVLISDITEPFALKGNPVNMLNNIKCFDNINFFQTCDEENGSIFIANIALLNNVMSSNVKMTLADLTKYEENMLNHIETVRKEVDLINKEFNKDGLDLEFFIDPKSLKEYRIVVKQYVQDYLDLNCVVNNYIKSPLIKSIFGNYITQNSENIKKNKMKYNTGKKQKSLKLEQTINMKKEELRIGLKINGDNILLKKDIINEYMPVMERYKREKQYQRSRGYALGIKSLYYSNSNSSNLHEEKAAVKLREFLLKIKMLSAEKELTPVRKKI